MIARLQPCLWYDGNAEEAARFYADTFPDSRIDKVTYAPADNPSTPKGAPLTVEMTILGLPFLLLNGGPLFKFTEAVSFQVATDDQAQTDRYWKAITGNGGAESQCGWCKDRFGVSWQVVPGGMGELFSTNPEGARRAWEAMMQMRKIDYAALQAAAEGEPVR